MHAMNVPHYLLIVFQDWHWCVSTVLTLTLQLEHAHNLLTVLQVHSAVPWPRTVRITWLWNMHLVRNMLLTWFASESSLFLMLLIVDVSHYFNEKSCAAASCVTSSINVGWFRKSSKCCSSDFCNNATGTINM